MGEFVRLEVSGGVGTIRLDRPPMNALNKQVQDELRNAAAEATERADVRAAVLYGGEKVFAAGADIKEMVQARYGDMVERAGPLSDAFDTVARIPKPVVAAVTGYALGGGCELALTADFRVCGDNAKLGQPEILLGIIPGAGGTQRLARLIGPARAKDLVFTGRFVDAEEALRIGLVDRVVAPDDVYSAAVEMASRFVEGPAVALRAAKAAIDGGLDGDLASGLRLESYLFAGLFATEDRAIGMRSFLENGPGKARFVGRGPHRPRPGPRWRRPGTTRSGPTSSITTGRPARTTRSGRSRTTSGA
jgi:enoyl-CoA hydratase